MRAIEQLFSGFPQVEVPSGARFSAHLKCEQTDFVRFNQGLVRQSGHVDQAECTFTLIQDGRQASMTINLGDDPAENLARMRQVVAQLAGILPELAEDPHLLLPEGVQSSIDLPDLASDSLAQAVEDIAQSAQGLDLVGILAQGPIGAAYIDSTGLQHAWQRSLSLLDYSVYATGDKAFKKQVAGPVWDGVNFHSQLNEIRERLPILFQPPKVLTPGTYRAWLTPAALGRILGMASMDAFSYRAQQRRQSGLQRLLDGVGTLDSRISLSEDVAGGTGPGFSEAGFAKPAKTALLANGKHASALVNPRTAREYGVPTTGSGQYEQPTSLSLAPGDLSKAEVLHNLDTGLWVDHLWYLNYSDRDACRITGMTRFATLWVENGVPVAPVNVMRFDDTLERMMGSELEALGSEAELCVNANSWGQRSTESARLAGALIRNWALTL